MMTYKKLSTTNYDLFLSICIWLNLNIQEVEYQKNKYKKAGNISEFNKWYNDLDLKRYKKSFNTAKKYLKGSDYYYLDYMTLNYEDSEISQKRDDFICDKFGY